MKRLSILLSTLLILGVSVPAVAGQDKVTLCHAAGLAGTTHYNTITVGWPAAYGPGGHFYENGTPRAGHEQDYLGPCKTEPPVVPKPDLPKDTGGAPRIPPPNDIINAIMAPAASFIGPCGDPRIKAVFDNSDSINAPVTFIWSYVRGKDNQRWWGSKTVAPGKVFTTKWHWVRGYTLATIEAVGIGPLLGTMVTKGSPWGTGSCQK